MRAAPVRGPGCAGAGEEGNEKAPPRRASGERRRGGAELLGDAIWGVEDRIGASSFLYKQYGQPNEPWLSVLKAHGPVPAEGQAVLGEGGGFVGAEWSGLLFMERDLFGWDGGYSKAAREAEAGERAIASLSPHDKARLPQAANDALPPEQREARGALAVRRQPPSQ